MPDPQISNGLLPPATPIEASPHAATIRHAHLAGSREVFTLAVAPRVVRDQLQLEACVSCAAAAAMEIRDKKPLALSAMSHYHLARVERRLGNSAGRLTLGDGLSTLENAGICSQTLHDAAMTDEGLAKRLSPDAKTEARNNRLLRQGLFPSHEPIGGGSRVVGIRRHLKQQRPVLLGFKLPRTYPDTFLASDHQWDDPSVDLSSDGHCVVVIGFNDVRGAFRIQDSRGDGKFDKGRWWMGYTVVDSAAILTAVALHLRQ